MNRKYYKWELRKREDNLVLGILSEVNLWDMFWWGCEFVPTKEFSSYAPVFEELNLVLAEPNMERLIKIIDLLNQELILVGIDDTKTLKEFILYIDGSNTRLRGLFEED
jgi:hypothetical protein